MRRSPAFVTLFLLGSLCPPGALAGQVAVGVKAGINLADVTSNQFGFGGVSRRTGPVGGAFLAVTGTGPVGFEGDLLYSQRGFSALVEGGTASAKLAYVDVPLLVRVRLVGEGHRLRPSLFGGWFFGFEIGCSLSGALEGIGGGGNCDALLERRGHLDGGFVIGGGVEYGLLDRTFLVADARYNWGQLNLNWQEADDRVLSQVWSFMGGVGILLGF